MERNTGGLKERKELDKGMQTLSKEKGRARNALMYCPLKSLNLENLAKETVSSDMLIQHGV